jgi:hypothetical protein
LQSRYQLITQSGMHDLTSPQNLSDDKLRLALYNSIRYLDSVTRLETELSITYAEAASVIQNIQREMSGDASEIDDASSQDLSHP